MAACPGGEHKNELVLNGARDELLDLMKGNLVLQYKWSKRNYRPSKAAVKGDGVA